MTETPHAALIAKLEALRERAVNDSLSVENEFATNANDEAESRQERDETNAVIDEAIAALQATPAGTPFDAPMVQDAIQSRNSEISVAEAQLAAQRTALEQLMKDWSTQATDEAIDRAPGWVGAEAALRACAQDLGEILQAAPTAEDGQ